MYKPITEKENWLATQIVDIAVCIHKAMGPGLLESIYEKCFCYELSKRGIHFTTSQPNTHKNFHIVVGQCITNSVIH